MRQNLLQMCLSIPAIPYRQLIAHGLNARQRKPFLAGAA